LALGHRDHNSASALTGSRSQMIAKARAAPLSDKNSSRLEISRPKALVPLLIGPSHVPVFVSQKQCNTSGPRMLKRNEPPLIRNERGSSGRISLSPRSEQMANIFQLSPTEFLCLWNATGTFRETEDR
jgi:hypothetical protein